MAEPHDRKPILTIEQQIEHLKQKGVAFELCSEEEAADYLRDKCNFFKLASYRKLFSKYEGGPRDGRYVDLDFGQLRLLAALDQALEKGSSTDVIEVFSAFKAATQQQSPAVVGKGAVSPAEAAKAAARADDRDDDQPFGAAGDDRYGRPPVPNNPQRMRVEPRL